MATDYPLSLYVSRALHLPLLLPSPLRDDNFIGRESIMHVLNQSELLKSTIMDESLSPSLGRGGGKDEKKFYPVMGNRPSSLAAVNGDDEVAFPATAAATATTTICPSLTDGQFALLLEFIAEDDPSDEAVKLVHAIGGGEPYAAMLKIPPSLGHDLLLLAPILSLVRSKEGRPVKTDEAGVEARSATEPGTVNYLNSQQTNGTDELAPPTVREAFPFTEEEANRITAYLAEMSQPEQAISCLVTLGVHGQLQAGRPRAPENCLLLLDCLHGALLAIVYACGGDPASFVSASRWLHRLHRMRLVLRGGTTVGPAKGIGEVQGRRETPCLPSTLSPSSPPSVERVVIEMALLTAVRQHYHGRDPWPLSESTIKTIMFAAGQCSLPGMDRYINICHLLLGLAHLPTCQVRHHQWGEEATDMIVDLDTRVDAAIGHFCTFIRGADEDSLALCKSLGLVTECRDLASSSASASSPSSLLPPSPYLAEQAIRLILQLPELSSSQSVRAGYQWKFISAALLYVEDWNESRVRVPLYGRLIETLLKAGHYRDAHDRLMEAWDGLQAAGRAEECTRQVVQHLLLLGTTGEALICSLVWNEAAASIIDQLLGEEERSSVTDYHSVNSPSHQLCYRWRLSRADVQGAALIMYQLAMEYYSQLQSPPSTTGSQAQLTADIHWALQLALSTLTLAIPPMDWLRLPDGTILSREHLWAYTVEAKAQASLGRPLSGGMSEALLVELLHRQQCSQALELLWASLALEHDDGSGAHHHHRSIKFLELILGFLLDSLMTTSVDAEAKLTADVYGQRPEGGRLRGFLSLLPTVATLGGERTLSVKEMMMESDDPMELIIIRCLLASPRLPKALVSHGISFVLDQLLAYGYGDGRSCRGGRPQGKAHDAGIPVAPIPAWLFSWARSSLDPNRLVRILGLHQQLDLLVSLLQDASIRDALTPGTRARLQLLVEG